MSGWWAAPLLIFAGITGPGGYWLLDPTAVDAMPHPLYFGALGLVLLALGILAIAAVLGFLRVVEHIIDTLAAINTDIDTLRALPRRDEVTA